MSDVKEPIVIDKTIPAAPIEAAPEAPIIEGEKPVEPKKEDKISKIVSKVNKKEQALKAKEADVSKKLADLKKYIDAPELAEKAPLELLQKLGINTDKLMTDIIKSGEAPSVDDKILTLEEKYKQMETKLEARERALEQKEAEMIISNFKQNVNKYIEDNKDSTCKLTKLLGKSSDVYDVIEEHHTRTGELLPLDKASKMVEDYYATEKRKEYDLLKTYFDSVKTPDNFDDDDEPIKPKTPTLTSKTAPTIPAGNGGGRLLSKDESIRAIAAKAAAGKYSN